MYEPTRPTGECGLEWTRIGTRGVSRSKKSHRLHLMMFTFYSLPPRGVSAGVFDTASKLPMLPILF
jgi:hypothetical protein